ncbi:MAG: hypothetical protein MUP81_03405 [Dehalococcoidia bacterium]|nr:hypothetical protein [Dehalococcoidia bacterium]
MDGIEGILAKYESAYAEAKEATAKREAEVRGLYDTIIARYGPGGTFGAGYEADIATQKVKGVGAGAQQLISSGLYGTEAGAGLERAWEAEVGTPARLKLADIKAERLSQAEQAKAGFVTGIEDVYPDYGSLMQYMAQIGNVPQVGGGDGTRRYTYPGTPTIIRGGGPQGNLPSQRMWTEEEDTIPWSGQTGGGGTSYGGTTGGLDLSGKTVSGGGYADVINKILGKVTIPKKTATKKTTTGYGEFAGGGGGTFGGYGYTGSW